MHKNKKQRAHDKRIAIANNKIAKKVKIQTKKNIYGYPYKYIRIIGMICLVTDTKPRLRTRLKYRCNQQRKFFNSYYNGCSNAENKEA